jgi:hypothetical protein
MFDNFAVRPLSGPEPLDPVNVAQGAKAAASSSWSNDYAARFVCDGDGQTRWNAAPGDMENAWVELDFSKPVRFNTVSVRQFGQRITKYKLQYFVGDQWRDAVIRERKGEDEWVDVFPAVESSKLRLVVVGVNGTDPQNNTPSIYEIEAFDTSLDQKK